MTPGAPEPRVHLGLQALQAPLWTRHRGFARYVRDHTMHLLKNHRELIAGLVLDPSLATPKELADYVGYGMFNQTSAAVAGRGPTIFHVMSPTFPSGPLETVFPRQFHHTDTRLVATLYDLIPLIYPQFYLTHPSVEGFYKSRYRLTSEADHALAISQATKDDAVRLLGMRPEQITVIYGAVSDYFVPADSPREVVRAWLRERVPAITKPFVLSILYTDEFGKRKNLEGAIAGFAMLPLEVRKGLQLVLVGHGFDSDFDKLGKLAREHDVFENLVFTGVMPDDLFRALYQSCELFIFPTFYEGLGLPILEAMQCGAPVITSDRSSTRELVEVEEARFDPDDWDDIGRAMHKPLTDAGYQQYLREYGLRRAAEFTWDRVARDTADCYRDVAASISSRRSWQIPRRRSVALVAPDAARLGVQDYISRLAEALAAKFPLEISLVEPEAERPAPAEGSSAVGRVSVRAFRWMAEHRQYDSVIYCMGNDPAYEETYELLKEFDGMVWLHDVRLSGFYRHHFEELERDLETIPPEMIHWTQRYPEFDNALLLRDVGIQHEHGIYLAGEVIHRGTRVVVNSRFAAELVGLEAMSTRSVVTVPMAAPPLTDDAPAHAGIKEAQGWVPGTRVALCLSDGDPRHCLQAVIGALAATPRLSDVNLVVAGAVTPENAERLREQASSAGFSQRLGIVEPNDTDEWLGVADVVVQLIYPTNGESSYGLMRALAAGVPSIVNDHGAYRELPDGVVFKVSGQPQIFELGTAIETVLSDGDERRKLSTEARLYAREVSFDNAAQIFWQEVILAS